MMEEIKSLTYKGRDGWKAESNIKLEGERLLKLSTWKGSRGTIQTNASVGKADGIGFWSHMLFSDYSKTVRETAGRCTEKSVTECHRAALAELDKTLADIKQFYAAKEAKQ